jgi:hypothetical protein
MVNKRTAARLDAYERRYRELARQLAGIGYIAAGSIALRPARCGKANCACHADPPRLHGPYWHVTQTIDGRTVNRRLTPEQAGLYSEWINNDRRAKEILTRMREVAAKAAELLLLEARFVQQDRTGPEARGSAQRRTSDRSRAQ